MTLPCKILKILTIALLLHGLTQKSWAMTPKYPYEPVSASCGDAIEIFGELYESKVEGNVISNLRLQADLNILETDAKPACVPVDGLKTVQLILGSPELIGNFQSLKGKNVLVNGSPTASDGKIVTIDVKTMALPPEK
jgi:hypothetical protein